MNWLLAFMIVSPAFAASNDFSLVLKTDGVTRKLVLRESRCEFKGKSVAMTVCTNFASSHLQLFANDYAHSMYNHGLRLAELNVTINGEAIPSLVPLSVREVCEIDGSCHKVRLPIDQQAIYDLLDLKP